MKALSVAKINENLINEDAATANAHLIAVSDGAGGGGVFAECWSRYLIEHLPDEPIADYKGFDQWIDKIWEPFYNDYEEKAKAEGGMLLNKFYDEGSFATLVTIWKNGQWISYGDSVAFCYDTVTKRLQHSFTKLSDFNNPPFLVNCKDPLDESGFRAGEFVLNDDCIIFAASDTLAHYVIMMYEVANREKFADELQTAIDAQTKNSNFIKAAMSLETVDFDKDVIKKLQNCSSWPFFKNHIKGLRKKGLIGHDDYSFVNF